LNLRKIEADSYREALAKVRSAYGDDALIVGTRTFQRGGVLGLGGKQVVEVYVTETKSRAERLMEARAQAPRAPAFALGSGMAYPEASEAVVPRTEMLAPAPSAHYERIATPFERALSAPVYERPAPPAQMQPHARMYELERPAPPVAERAPSAMDRKLGEIGLALEQLSGEVQHLLRRSEGPPWGHPMLDAAYALLKGRDVEDDLARRIIARLDRSVLPEQGMDEAAFRGILAAHMARFIAEAVPERPARDGRIKVFIGPTGVGKTTTIAKLAARERYTCGRSVALITLDTFRIAAVDQLRKYADIIGLELRVVTDPPGLREAINGLGAYERIFIDSAGRSPADELRLGELTSFVRCAPEAQVSLVVSATTSVRTLQRSIERFARVGFDDLVVTKLDETQARGVILSAIVQAARPVSFLTNGQNVPDDLEAADPQRVADLILQGG
jgi:flagellar biosynthesis protein FlhF